MVVVKEFVTHDAPIQQRAVNHHVWIHVCSVAMTLSVLDRSASGAGAQAKEVLTTERADWSERQGRLESIVRQLEHQRLIVLAGLEGLDGSAHDDDGLERPWHVQAERVKSVLLNTTDALEAAAKLASEHARVVDVE
jgi:hypothetical protein